MISIKNRLQGEAFQRYREPGILFGGGLLAGLLLFLVWLFFLSSSDRDSQAAPPATSANATQDQPGAGAGALNGITEAPQPGQARVTDAAAGEGPAASAGPSGVTENSDAATGAADAGSANPGGTVSDGEAIANGLLGPATPANPEPTLETTPADPVNDAAKDH